MTARYHPRFSNLFVVWDIEIGDFFFNLKFPECICLLTTLIDVVVFGILVCATYAWQFPIVSQPFTIEIVKFH